MFLTKDRSLEENSNVYQAHLICINWDVVNYQLSGYDPYLVLRRAAIYITILGYTLFLYGLTFFYISLHSFFFWETENKGKLRVNWRLFPTSIWVLQYLIIQPFLPIIFCKYVIWPKSSINSFLPIPNLRQLKFTIKWQYKF